MRVFGEGLGGGYRTPPNERDVSAANAEKGGFGGQEKHPNGQLSTGGFRARGFKNDLKMI